VDGRTTLVIENLTDESRDSVVGADAELIDDARATVGVEHGLEKASSAVARASTTSTTNGKLTIAAASEGSMAVLYPERYSTRRPTHTRRLTPRITS
jgi:hypothetical protein